MKVLFLFWHGLGDNILATPAIRAYKKANPDHYIGWAMLKRFKSAQLYNPYIDEYHFTNDAWNDFRNYDEGRASVISEAQLIVHKQGYDKLVIIDHKSSGKHKIHRTADEMGVTVTDTKTEFYFQYPQTHISAFNSVFFHGRTGVKNKDLPLNHIIKRREEIQLPVKSKDIINANLSKPLWYWAEWLFNASDIYVVDSVYFHIACALGIKPTLSYFARGKSTFDIVKPLHMDVSDTVIYEL